MRILPLTSPECTGHNVMHYGSLSGRRAFSSRENLRDWEYSGLIDIVRENLLLGVNVILVGPFSREIQSGKMFSPTALGIPPETSIRLAWIDLEEKEAKLRIEQREDPRDDWKLANWNQYAKRRIEPPEHPAIFRFDNLQFNEERFEKLVEQLTQ